MQQLSVQYSSYSSVPKIDPSDFGENATLTNDCCEKLKAFANSVFYLCGCEVVNIDFRKAILLEDITDAKRCLREGATGFIRAKDILHLAKCKQFTSLEFLISQMCILPTTSLLEEMTKALHTLKESDTLCYRRLLEFYLKYASRGGEKLLLTAVNEGLVAERPKYIPAKLESISKFDIKHLSFFLDLTLKNLGELLKLNYSPEDVAVINCNDPMIQYICYAHFDDSIPCIKLLLVRKYPPDGLYHEKNPLWHAVNCNNLAAIQILLEAKANPHLHEVAWKLFYNEQGECIHDRDKECSPFQKALMQGNMAILMLFEPHVEGEHKQLLKKVLETGNCIKNLRNIKE